jgi:hypothetical protein
MISRKIYKNRKRIIVRLAYVMLAAVSVGLIAAGLIQMAASAPTPALIAMSGVTSLTFLHHDISLMMGADRRGDGR